MQLKPEQERVSTLLKETITLMCKNGLKFETKFTIDAVIGVTLDEKEVFLISVNEIFNAEQSEREVNTDDSSGSDTGSIVHRRKRRRKRAIKKESHGDGELAEDQAEEDKPCVQLESTDHDSNDDSSILFIKEEPQSSWQVLAGTYQDTGDQSKSEAMVSYPSDNVMPDGAAVNFANVSYQSANNNSSMTWSSPGQSGASYISSSGDQLGMPHLAGHAQQGQNQVRATQSNHDLPPGHYPERFPSRPGRDKPTKRCRVCYVKGRRKEVRNFCAGCSSKPGLCLGECFRLFHTQQFRRHCKYPWSHPTFKSVDGGSAHDSLAWT